MYQNIEKPYTELEISKKMNEKASAASNTSSTDINDSTAGLHKRCIRCRSRGDLGKCRDPFPFNVTDPEAEVGVHVVACPSGWCGKLTEGNSASYKVDDYGAATERMCLQRAPSDYEERCAYTMWNHKKVYMCFCSGDLCNSGVKITATFTILISMFISYCNI